MDMSKEEQNKVFVVLMEVKGLECKPIGMFSNMVWALSMRLKLQTNFPGYRFTVMQWDFVDADTLCVKCSNNLKSLLE